MPDTGPLKCRRTERKARIHRGSHHRAERPYPLRADRLIHGNHLRDNEWRVVAGGVPSALAGGQNAFPRLRRAAAA